MKAKRLLAVFAAFMMSAAVFAVGCGDGNGSESGAGEPGGQGGEQTRQYTVTLISTARPARLRPQLRLTRAAR